MKYQLQRNFLFTLLITTIGHSIFAQNVTITPTGITPAPLAVDIPKLTFDQIQALPSPQLGDLVTDITFKCLRFHNGEKWLRIMTNFEVNYKESRAFGFGSNSNDSGVKIVIDNNQNFIMVGYYEAAISFGSYNLSYTGTNSNPDVFIAKIKKDGTVLFAKKIDMLGIASIYDFKIDNSDNLYISGSSGDSQFESYSLGRNWVLKLNSNGSYSWSKSTLANSAMNFRSLTIDNSSKVYVAAQVSGSNVPFEGYSFTANNSDMIIFAFEPNGSLLWFKQTSGSGYCYPKDIGIDSQNNLIIFGYTSGIEDFGAYGTSLTGNFLAKYTAVSSTWNWLFTIPNFDNSKMLIKNDEIYVAGNFFGTQIFSVGNSVTSAGSSDLFVAKYNYQLDNSTNPYIVLLKSYGGTDTETFGGIDVDANGNIFLAGTFYGNDFEIDGNAARNNYDNKEVFIAKLNAQGKGIWIKTPDGRHELGDNSFNDLKVDNAGNAYGFGRYNFDVKIGPNNLSATNGSYDILLMQVVD